MKKKRMTRRKKAQLIGWIIGCFLFLFFIGYGSSYALPTQVPQKTLDKASSLYVMNKKEGFSQRQEISINVNGALLITVLTEVAQKAHVGISYQESLIPDKKITAHLKNVSVFQALQQILKGTQLKVVLPFSRDVLVVKKEQNELNNQQKEITGTVTDAKTGKPLIGVNILVVGTSTGTVTDVNGHYSLTVSSLQDTLRFSYIGYQSKTVPINGRTTINVALKSTVTGLNQLVVTGFGTTTKKGVLTSSVSVIETKELKNKPVVSASGLLQGRSAGVQVSSTSGVPGSGLRIKIRGTTSITGSSEPLYIVDGVPVTTGSFGLGTGGATTSAMAYLNPSDIKSITILKDAAATAIYGARAANGVVIIKTKRGANKPMKIHFGTYAGFQWAVNTPDLVTAKQFEMLQNEAARINGEPIPYQNPSNDVYTPWAELVFRRGSIVNSDLSITGGNEKVQYAVTGGHFKNIGITKPAAFRRSTIRLNLDLNASDKLSLGTSISYSHTHRNRGRNNDAINGILTGAFFMPPNLPVYQPDGSYTTFSIFANPVAAIKEVDFNMDVSRFIGNAFAQYDFTPHLSGKLSWSLDLMQVDNRRYNNSKTISGGAVNGAALFRTARSRRWTGELTLNYITDLGKHHFDVLVGGSLESRHFESLSATGQQFPSDAFHYLGAAAVQTATSGAASAGLASIYGRIQYNYAGNIWRPLRFAEMVRRVLANITNGELFRRWGWAG